MPGKLGAVDVAESRHEPALVEAPVALGHPPATHEPRVFREELHHLVRGIAVRVQEDVRQPGLPEPAAHLRLRVDGMVVARARADVYAE